MDETKRSSSVQNYPLRKAQEVSDGVRVSLRRPEVIYRWPDSQPTSEILESLRYRAARVGYLGRSDSMVRLRVEVDAASDEGGQEDIGLMTWRPSAVGTVFLGVPDSGFLERLDRAFDQFTSGRPMRRSWIPTHQSSYATANDEAHEPGERGSAIWLRFARGVAGHKVRHVAEALKALVLARYEQESGQSEIPPVLHGHWPSGTTGYQNVRWISLPHAGYPHADGMIRGACVWLPADTETSVVEAVRRILVGTDRLYRGSVLDVQISPFDGARYPWTSNPARWTGPARHWVTVFPAVHERYTKGRLTIDDVSEWCSNAGYPPPISFRESEVPLVDGAADLSPIRIFGPGRKHYPYSHLEIIFSRPVRGPIAIGRGRSHGFGLMAPVRTNDTSEEGS